jgi:plastocyanin
MKKIIYVIIALVIIAGAYYFYDQRNKQVKAPVETTQTNGEQAITQESGNQLEVEPVSKDAMQDTMPATRTDVTTEIQGTFSSGEETGGQATDIQVVEVSYDGSKFTPDSVDIKVNDYVFFKNNSDDNFWPASASHPTHDEYPEFDSKKAIAPGQTFKFQFTKAGSWKYHDHLNSSAGGVVNVAE